MKRLKNTTRSGHFPRFERLRPISVFGGLAFTVLAACGLHAVECYQPPHPIDRAEAVALQADGKIVVAGRAGPGLGNFGLVRYLEDGSLDPSFGNGGKLTDSFGGNDFVLDVTILGDGKILVTGTMEYFNVPDGNLTGNASNGNASNGNTASNASPNSIGFALARYLPDGSRDSTFGAEGVVRTGFRNARAATVLPDGKILVTGRPRAGFELVVARFHADGGLDTGFGEGGQVTAEFGGIFEYGNDVVSQPDGKIIAVGWSRPRTGSSDFVMARFLLDGSLDASFGNGGKVITDVAGDDSPGSVVLQPDGKILVGGSSETVAGNDSSFALVRYHPDGSVDTGFADAGVFTFDFDGNRDTLRDLSLQADGKIILAGSDRLDAGSGADFALIRLNPDGTPDPAFGQGGKLTTDISGEGDWLNRSVIQPDGKIVAVGGTLEDFALVRYLPDGSLDSDFGTGGGVTTDLAGPPPEPPAPVLPRPDNRIGRSPGEQIGSQQGNHSGVGQSVRADSQNGRAISFYFTVGRFGHNLCSFAPFMPDDFKVRAVGRGRNFKIDYFRLESGLRNVTGEIMGNGIEIENAHRDPAARFVVRIRPRKGIRRSKTVMITTRSEASPLAKDVVRATVHAKK